MKLNAADIQTLDRKLVQVRGWRSRTVLDIESANSVWEMSQALSEFNQVKDQENQLLQIIAEASAE